MGGLQDQNGNAILKIEAPGGFQQISENPDFISFLKVIT